MKTQLSKPARSKARYTEEYKQEALELWRNGGRSAAKVAAELGIRAPLLYRWHGQSAKPLRAKLSSALDKVLNNWKRRSVACAQRTLNFWSNVKF
jgi:transposase-like protein